MALDTVGSNALSWALDVASFAAGQSIATPNLVNGLQLVGIQMPSIWTPASLTFLGSADNVLFQSIFDNAGNEVTVTAAAGHYLMIPYTVLFRVPFLQLRSGTTATPVNQAAASQLQLVFSAYQ